MDIPHVPTWRLPFYGHSLYSDLETARLWTFPMFRPGDSPSMNIPHTPTWRLPFYGHSPYSDNLTWRLPFYRHSPYSDLETALLWTFPIF